MKKFLIFALAIVMAVSTQAQTCIPPTCGVSFVLSHSYSNTYINNFNNNARGVVCFDGQGSVNVITQSMQVANITTFIFNPNGARYQVNQTVNLQNKAKIYVKDGANVTLTSLSMNGGDTIFVAGDVDINNVTNVNNSTTGNRAVIVVQGGGTVRIEGEQYVVGETFINVVTPSATNQIDIIRGCDIVTPVRFGNIEFKPKKQ